MTFELTELVHIVSAAGAMAQAERSRLSTELKPDGSIVTQADRAVESFLRSKLPTLISGTTVWGEEFGREPEGETGLWLVDPIDGTTNFANGLPLWGVSVALWQHGQLRSACIDLPDLQMCLSAVQGDGAFINGSRLPMVSPGIVQSHEPISCCPAVAPLIRSEKALGRLRCFGASVVDGGFTVTQRLRGLYGNGERMYDIAAVLTLANEVGLEYRYLDDLPLNLESLVDGKPIRRPWKLMPPISQEQP
jgi:myo-inositol-1(or 4)-monophosphatase